MWKSVMVLGWFFILLRPDGLAVQFGDFKTIEYCLGMRTWAGEAYQLSPEEKLKRLSGCYEDSLD